MPGIAGVISREPAAVCRRRLAAMIESMCHEVHYQSATCEAPEIGVYAGWVAHPGSFAARESGTNTTGAVDLVFAGEVVNDRSDAAASAEARHERGKSSGTVLGFYERLGEDGVVELNGLFSGLLIDRRRARAFLFNDRYAIERVYVHEADHGIYFASEAKALLRVLPATRSFDEQGVAQFLTFGCALDDRTLFRDIATLPGGSIWTFQDGSCRKRRYFTPAQWEHQPALSPQDFQSEFQQVFTRSLPRYLRGDLPLGISATGGLDTRMIVACLPALPRAPICYTFAGVDGETLDVRIAARLASECGFEHRTLRLGQDFLSEYATFVDRTVYATDGACGATGAHEIYLSAQARRLAPVRLTGNYGSEVLRSMSTFRRIGLWPELIAPDFRAQLDEVYAGRANEEPTVAFAAFREIPWSLFGILAAEKSQLTIRTPFLDNDLVALTHRAPVSVRTSSASAMGLIAAAHPRLAAIPTDRAVVAGGRGARYALKRLFAEVTFKLDYMHKEAPPRGTTKLFHAFAALDRVGRLGLLGRHKWLPYRLWFQKELAPYVTAVLCDSETHRLPFWDRRALATMAREHVSGRRNYVREINAVLTLAAVDRLLVRGTADTVHDDSAVHDDVRTVVT
jgi:asparagine synthase (glutamine-hydrolysing)